MSAEPDKRSAATVLGTTRASAVATISARPARSGSRLVVPSFGRIASVESLEEHLAYAIELEHSTLPPYLCARYSLDPSPNPAATEVVGSVFVEEMLHLTLAANLLNAVGGRPRFDIPETLPAYPGSLPHSDRSFAFNRTYCAVPSMLDRAFDGRPQTLGEAIGVMYGLKSQAHVLMQMPTEDRLKTAGPTFEYVSPVDR